MSASPAPVSSETTARFGPSRPIYAFTTENLGGYLPRLNLANRHVLTVCGSGDHVINCLLFGAASVTAFDINPAALRWTELKLAALRSLTYPAFMSFFMRGSSEALDYQTYTSLLLGPETRDHFDELYANSAFDGALMRESSVFANRHDSTRLALSNNPYLRDAEQYSRARRRCEMPVRLIDAPLRSVSTHAAGPFDAVLLSNIADYAREMFPGAEDYLMRFVAERINSLKPLLAKDGVIVAAYLYDCTDTLSEATAHSDLDIAAKRRDAFSCFGWACREIQFPSVIAGREDAVVVLA